MEGTAHTTPVAPGDVLAGKYRVERLLGRGAMGVVVSARHMELGEHVARVTDVGRLENGSPYMVMEHLAGSDLQVLVRDRGPLPIDQAVLLVLQACDALSEAHALGIVHRDLKPSNLFLTTRANGTACLKLLDFGISKQIAPEGVDLTKTGEVFGTPLYMAPEQMARTKDVDARSDIWSLGAVLYELLTGKSPFHATTLTEVIARALQEDAVRPSSIRPDIPPLLDAIVLRCLQKRPADRYQHITELAASLRGLEGHASAAVGILHIRSNPGPATSPAVPASSVQTSPTLPLPVSRSSNSDPSIQSGPGTPGANTASSWGATGSSRSVKGGNALPLFIGGIVAAVCAAVGLWLLVRPTNDSATPAIPDSGAAELPPPIALVTASSPSAGVTAPATAALDPPASAATLPVHPPTSAAPSSARPLPPPGKAATPIPTKTTRPAENKNYQDAF